jgi:hypothetical protein
VFSNLTTSTGVTSLLCSLSLHLYRRCSKTVVVLCFDARERKIRRQTLQDIFVKTNPLCIPSSRTYKIEDTNSSASARLLRWATFGEYRALSSLLRRAWRNAGLVHV